MNKHLDVVVSQWADGTEERVAVLVVNGGPPTWQILNPAYDYVREAAEELGDVDLIDRLPEALTSTYMTVVPLHTDADCLFAADNTIHIPGAAAG